MKVKYKTGGYIMFDISITIIIVITHIIVCMSHVGNSIIIII